MVKRSRLRTQRVGRRRLVTIVVLLGVLAGAATWYSAKNYPQLWDRVGRLFISEKGAGADLTDTVRGTIYDRNYRELAVSYERVSLYANIREIADLAGVIEPLAETLAVPASDLYARVGIGSLRIWLARDISQEQEEEIDRLALPGIYLHKEYARYYPQKDTAAHLIGYVERDTGLAGIEHFLSRLENKHRLDRKAVEDLPLIADGRPGIDGRHLILTLDLKIQRILDNYLETVSDQVPGSKRGALVLEAASGSLVGYAQTPSFDANRFHAYPETLFDDVFNETMAVPEPFKLFLRELSLLESQPADRGGPIPWSVAEERRKLGVQLQLWERLGASSRESYDFFSSPAVGTERVAFDQAAALLRNYETVPVMQTPLQLLTSITRSTNGGTAIKPHAADRFVLRQNQSEFMLEDFQQPIKTGLLRPGQSTEIRRLYQAMGKTGPLASAMLSGTSTSYRMNGGMNSFKRHHLLVALIPAQDPELVLMVVGADPGYLTEQAEKADPMTGAASIIAPIVALQRVMKNLTDMMSPRDLQGINYRSIVGEDQPVLYTDLSEEQPLTESQTIMPTLVGMSLRKGLRILQHAGVTVTAKGTGRVVAHEPAAGAVLSPGAQVTLILERDRVDADFRKESESGPP